jgi:glutaminyl-peptide cyclotransferase
VRVRAALPDGRFEDLPDSLDRTDRLRNVVGRLPGRRPAVVVGAHYDVEAEPEGFVGANDGAAGTAAVVEIARALRRARRPAGAPEIRFVLFDGEEEPAGCDDFERCGIRGSRAYVREHADEVGALVLLDYVAEKGARFPREGSSDPELWSRLRASARRTGNATFFPAEVGASIIDDHTPFLQEGIPAVDVIDFDYPHRDTLRDTVDKTSARTLDAVGETVVDLLLRWR